MRNWGGDRYSQGFLGFVGAVACDQSELLPVISRNYCLRSKVSGRGTLRDGGHDIRMITILIHIHVRST